MKSPRPLRQLIFSLPVLIGLSLSLGLCLPSLAQAARTLHDMADSPVVLPDRVKRIATIGATPVINSLVFTLGASKHIINGLPEFARKPRWGYQYVFAPQLMDLPSLQNPDRSPNLEAIAAAAPDAVLTMDRPSAEALRRAGIPALYLSWREPYEIKRAITLLGELLARPHEARRYAEYFDTRLAYTAQRLKSAATPLQRPRVLYFSPATLSQPHQVAEWWIRLAGGDSVTDDGRQTESRSFTIEQLHAWNPDILIVSSRAEAAALRHEPRYAGLAAVQRGRILITPCGAHTWGNRSAEQPLTVLWAAKHFHPALFHDLDLVAETQRFYREHFRTALSFAQVREILDGGPVASVIGGQPLAHQINIP
jgi:iron complex transport system substrate-binding protein